MTRLSIMGLENGRLVETAAAEIPQRWMLMHPIFRMDPAYWIRVHEIVGGADASDDAVKAAIKVVDAEMPVPDEEDDD